MTSRTLLDEIEVLSGSWSNDDYTNLYKPMVAVFADSSVPEATPLILSALRTISSKTPIESIFACGVGTGLRTLNTFATDPFGKLNWEQTLKTASQYVTAMQMRPLEIIFIMGSAPEITSTLAIRIQEWYAATSGSVVRVHCLSFAETNTETNDKSATELMFKLTRIGSTSGLFVNTPLEHFNEAVNDIVAVLGTPSPRVTLSDGNKKYPAITTWCGDHLEYRIFGQKSILDTLTGDVSIDTGIGETTIPHTQVLGDPAFETFKYAILMAAIGSTESLALFREIKTKVLAALSYRTYARTYIAETLNSLGEEPAYGDISRALFTSPKLPKGLVATISPPEGFEMIDDELYNQILACGDFIVAGGTTFDRVTSLSSPPAVFPLPLFLNEEHATVAVQRLKEYAPDVLMRQCLNAISQEFAKPLEENMSPVVIESAKWIYRILQPTPLPFPGPFGSADKNRLNGEPSDHLIEYIAANQKPTPYMVVAALEETTRRVVGGKVTNLKHVEIEKLIWNLLDLNDSPFDWNVVPDLEYNFPNTSPDVIDPREQFTRALNSDLDSVLASLKTPDEYFIFPEAERCAKIYLRLFGEPYQPDVHSHIAMCLQNMLQSNNRIRARAISKVLSFMPLGGDPYMIVHADLDSYVDFISPGSNDRARLYLRTLFGSLVARHSWKEPTGDLKLFATTDNLYLASATLKGLLCEDQQRILDLFLNYVPEATEKLKMVTTGHYEGVMLFTDGAELIKSPLRIKNKKMQLYKAANPSLAGL